VAASHQKLLNRFATSRRAPDLGPAVSNPDKVLLLKPGEAVMLPDSIAAPSELPLILMTAVATHLVMFICADVMHYKIATIQWR